MGDIKEIFDVWVTRIRAPIFGYYSLSFLAANWKGIYYLLFAETNAVSRIEYFELNTSIASLILIPLGLALVATLGYPWVQYWLMLATANPNNKKSAINANAESELLALKMELENKRSELARQEESEVVEKAKIDESIEKIENAETRDKARETIRSIRSKETLLGKPINKNSLEEYLQIQYPNEPSNDPITSVFLQDINPSKYQSIRDIDTVIQNSVSFIEFYKNIEPSVFNSGIDYITKSFGYTDPDFRRKHGFSKDTLKAIKDYNHLT